MEDLLEAIIAIAHAFDRVEIPHSFGGAIALGYYATARATRDISHMLDTVGAGLDVSYVLRWVEALVGSDTDSARQLVHELTRRSLTPAS